MAYIGRPLQVANLAVQSGTGDGSDTTPIATLDYATTTNGIAVYLDGVRQLAGTDFNVTAQTTLTFTTAPANSVGIDVYFLGLELSLPTPADRTVTLAKMATGTDGNIISYDASGNPVAIATGTDGQVLTSTGAGSPPAFEALPASGKVLQVLIVEDSSPMTLSSDTYTDTNLSLSITPSATSSKILAMWNVQAEADVASAGFGTRLVRGSTNVYTSTQLYDTFVTDSGDRVRSDYKHLDSPSTTSAVVYKVQVATYTSKEMTFNDASNQTQLVLMEIGA